MSQSVLFYQSFIGVDLHKTTVTLVAVAPDGTMIGKLTINTNCREKITAWLLALPRPSHLAVEAVGFVEWFIDDFRPASIASTSPTPPNWPTAAANGGRTTGATPSTWPNGSPAANVPWATSPTTN